MYSITNGAKMLPVAHDQMPQHVQTVIRLKFPILGAVLMIGQINRLGVERLMSINVRNLQAVTTHQNAERTDSLMQTAVPLNGPDPALMGTRLNGEAIA